ncbi:unnamed protein product [Closterium sp. NIES-64]|nr:unnamed protein product [Closterium sp. NIES-64]
MAEAFPPFPLPFDDCVLAGPLHVPPAAAPDLPPPPFSHPPPLTRHLSPATPHPCPPHTPPPPPAASPVPPAVKPPSRFCKRSLYNPSFHAPSFAMHAPRDSVMQSHPSFAAATRCTSPATTTAASPLTPLLTFALQAAHTPLPLTRCHCPHLPSLRLISSSSLPASSARDDSAASHVAASAWQTAASLLRWPGGHHDPAVLWAAGLSASVLTRALLGGRLYEQSGCAEGSSEEQMGIRGGDGRAGGGEEQVGGSQVVMAAAWEAVRWMAAFCHVAVCDSEGGVTLVKAKEAGGRACGKAGESEENKGGAGSGGGGGRGGGGWGGGSSWACRHGGGGSAGMRSPSRTARSLLKATPHPTAVSTTPSPAPTTPLHPPMAHALLGALLALLSSPCPAPPSPPSPAPLSLKHSQQPPPALPPRVRRRAQGGGGREGGVRAASRAAPSGPHDHSSAAGEARGDGSSSSSSGGCRAEGRAWEGGHEPSVSGLAAAAVRQASLACRLCSRSAPRHSSAPFLTADMPVQEVEAAMKLLVVAALACDGRDGEAVRAEGGLQAVGLVVVARVALWTKGGEGQGEGQREGERRESHWHSPPPPGTLLPDNLIPALTRLLHPASPAGLRCLAARCLSLCRSLPRPPPPSAALPAAAKQPSQHQPSQQQPSQQQPSQQQASHHPPSLQPPATHSEPPPLGVPTAVAPHVAFVLTHPSAPTSTAVASPLRVVAHAAIIAARCPALLSPLKAPPAPAHASPSAPPHSFPFLPVQEKDGGASGQVLVARGGVRAEGEEGVVREVRLGRGVSGETFSQLLEYIYTGQVSLSHWPSKDLLQLAKKCRLDGLVALLRCDWPIWGSDDALGCDLTSALATLCCVCRARATLPPPPRTNHLQAPAAMGKRRSMRRAEGQTGGGGQGGVWRCVRVAAHRCVLGARSQYLHALLHCGMRESSQHEVQLPPLPLPALIALLRFLYSARVSFLPLPLPPHATRTPTNISHPTPTTAAASPSRHHSAPVPLSSVRLPPLSLSTCLLSAVHLASLAHQWMLPALHHSALCYVASRLGATWHAPVSGGPCKSAVYGNDGSSSSTGSSTTSGTDWVQEGSVAPWAAGEAVVRAAWAAGQWEMVGEAVSSLAPWYPAMRHSGCLHRLPPQVQSAVREAHVRLLTARP